MLGTDSELAAQAKRGDLAAYEELASRHWEAVYRVSYAITGDHHQAQDAAQECLVQAYSHLGRFDEARAFGPWLKGIAVNCALMEVRRGQRTRQALPADGPSRSDEGPRESATNNAFEAAVRQSIDQLPTQQRTAMRLFALDDMDLSETAQAMGCAVGTVKTHLHRARHKLRQLLADYLREDVDNEV